MKIAILTFHRAYNCGAMLQAWALKTVLERMGHTVEFPICNHVGESRRWALDWVDSKKSGIAKVRSFIGRTLINLMSVPTQDVLRARYRRFRNKYLPERLCNAEGLDKFYDLIVVGSDQVWNPRIAALDSPLFLAETLPTGIGKVAYAVSYGDKPLSDDELKRVLAAVNRFSSVSVRETLAQRQLSDSACKPIEVVADPTLLLKAVDYEELCTGIKTPCQPYLFMYTLWADKFFFETAKELARRLGVKCVIAPCYQYSRYGAPKGLTYSVSPERLVALARGAKYVLAGSFHGTVMGVLFKKSFLSLRGQVDEHESRPAALLNRIGCGNRLVNPTTSLDEMEKLLKSDLPDSAYAKLNDFRDASLAWLKSSLTTNQ